jgi:hypothetical protein
MSEFERLQVIQEEEKKAEDDRSLELIDELLKVYTTKTDEE